MRRRCVRCCEHGWHDDTLRGKARNPLGGWLAVPGKPGAPLNAARSLGKTPPREQFAALDAADPLAALRQLFELPPEVIYLDGNSLGPLPKATADRVQQSVRDEWGRGLITSWNHAGWIDLPRRLGDKVARLIGAAAGEVV